MARYPEMFRIAPQSLRLDRERSAPSGALWFVELQQFQQGVPVVGAKVYFRINNGNIVQFGADRIAEVGISVQPALGASEARSVAWTRSDHPSRTSRRLWTPAGSRSIPC